MSGMPSHNVLQCDHCTPRKQQGATLVEVLVSLLIVSLGLLGIGGLAASTFSYNKAAQLRLTGAALASDYVDRARLNIFGYDQGNYNITYGDTVDTAALDPNILNVDEAIDASAATAVASFDRNDFIQTVGQRLPQGRAVVVTNPANARSLDLWLVWQEPNANQGDTLSIFQAGQRNCPNDLPTAVVTLASCMYFRVNL